MSRRAHRRPFAAPSVLRARAAALALAGLFSAGCAAIEEEADVSMLVSELRFAEALEVAQERVDRAPDDERFQADLDLARSAVLLEQGRHLTIEEGQHAEALARFEAAAALLPGHPVPEGWVAKTRRKLFDSLSRAAFEAEATGDFQGALVGYREASQYAPVGEDGTSRTTLAEESIERVRQAIAYRGDRSDDYYNDGVRSIRRFRTAEAARDFASALKFRPEAEDAVQRREQVDEMLAEERLRIAAELEGQGLHRAAANEYRIAQLYRPDNAEALAGEARAEVEIEVLNALDEVDRLLRRERFDEAFVILEEAEGKTALQADDVAAALAGAEQAQLQHLYDTAIELQSDYRFDDAIAAYDELLETAGGFYDDAISRRDTVVDFMAEAERVYGLYEAAEDDEQRLRHLRNIELIWPTYKDVEQRLRELR